MSNAVRRSSSPRVLNVGQCGYDHRMISGFLSRQFGAQVVPADTWDEARAALECEGFQLVLVNRLLDLDGSSGLELIRAMMEDPALSAVPVMLVSDYPTAQQAAEELGARQGFGKSALGTPATIDRLKALLG